MVLKSTANISELSRLLFMTTPLHLETVEEDLEYIEETYADDLEDEDYDEEDETEIADNGELSYVQTLLLDEENKATLLSGLTSKARELLQAFSADDSAVQFYDGVQQSDEFLYRTFQSAIVREYRLVTMRELYQAVDAADSYGTQAEVNTTSISNILADTHIGLFKVQQLLTVPHLTERVDVVSGQREYVGVGLRHRVVTLTLLAHAAGVDISSEEWLEQKVECQVSSSINAEGVEDTELSGALVLADNASRKAYQGEKASFKLNSLGITYNEESLVAAAFSGRIQTGEALGIILSMYSDELQRKSTTLLSFGKGFYSRAKKFITSKAQFVSVIRWITDNYNTIDRKFRSENSTENIARETAKFATYAFEVWKEDTGVQEPVKAKVKKQPTKGAPKLFRKSV